MMAQFFQDRPGLPSQEAYWKGALLASMIIHVGLVWLLFTWWQHSGWRSSSKPEIIEVNVVSRPGPPLRPEPLSVQTKEKPRLKPTVKPKPPEAVVRKKPLHKPLTKPVPEKIPAPKPVPVKSPDQMVIKDPVTPEVQDETVRPAPVDGIFETAVPEHLSGDNPSQESILSTPSVTVVDRKGAIASSGGANENIRSEYHNQLRTLIEKHKRYPLMARKGHQEGLVRVGFTLHADGNLRTAQVVRSCGHRLLDRAALKAVKAVDCYPAIPEVIEYDTRFEIDISFTLE